MRDMIARLLARLRKSQAPAWRDRLGLAGREWKATGARMLASHIAFADRPVAYSTAGFEMKRPGR